MALDGTEFTTLETLQEELGDLTGVDSYLERVIRSVDAQIRAYIGRPTMHQSTATLQPVRVLNERELCIIPSRGPLPVTAITAFELNEEALDPTELGIVDADMGIIRYSSLLFSTTDSVGNIERDLYPGLEDESDLKGGYTMTWTGGWVMPGQAGTRTFPYDLEDAGLLLASYRHFQRNRDTSIASESLLSYSVSYGGASSMTVDLPMGVKAVLDRYRVVF